MEIKRAGSQPSAEGPSEWFTGTVRIDPLFQAPDPALSAEGPAGFASCDPHTNRDHTRFEKSTLDIGSQTAPALISV
jgi:hypothetical protein